MFVTTPTLIRSGFMCGFAALAITTPPALSRAQDDERASVLVGFHDLDLARPEARLALADRVERAVRRVCDIDDARNLQDRMAYQDCYRQAALVAGEQVRVVFARLDQARDPRLAAAGTDAGALRIAAADGQRP